jgi:hypothetical protein
LIIGKNIKGLVAFETKIRSEKSGLEKKLKDGLVSSSSLKNYPTFQTQATGEKSKVVLVEELNPRGAGEVQSRSSVYLSFTAVVQNSKSIDLRLWAKSKSIVVQKNPILEFGPH